jgi:hypothetical protein
MIFRAKDDRRADDGIGNTAPADVFLSDTFGFVYGERRGTVGTDMTEIDEPAYIRRFCNLCKCTCTLDICFEEVTLPTL